MEHVDVTARPEDLVTPGVWALVGTFEGAVHAWRFDEVVERSPASGPSAAAPGVRLPWRGPGPDAWTSSLDETAYRHAVERVRHHVRTGRVYQANLCRVLRAPLPAPYEGTAPDAAALAGVLAAGNPAPYAGWVHVPRAACGPDDPGAWVVTASPELFLRVEGDGVTSAPIKGTAATAAGLSDKDRAENVMITDLVRNDLQRVCRPGTVAVDGLLRVEQHPGLVHLVSTVTGRLDPALTAAGRLWGPLLAAAYPPGSVSGAPKRSALDVIAELEPVPRGPYCGAVGWVRVGEDGAVRAELAVGIRTFWWTPDDGGTLRFGTGAGITWGSDPAAEWAETELKAARLVALASGARMAL
ncbi:chorismate-binding protein [Cellulomonas marina]|uniref:chorismate-binding protein n=1 Tax=Cellulomonas marina TaxID=988821 RepID=UPI003570FF54